MAKRESYQDVIDRDRQQQLPAAEARRKYEPPRARPDYRRRRELNADLERYYEQCRQQSRGRFRTERREKEYCAAVAWTRVEKTGRYPDYPTFQQPSKRGDPMAMPKRNPRTGRFMKKRASAPTSSRRRSRSASAAEAPRRRRARAAYEEAPKRRRGRSKRRAREEAPRARRSRARRSSGRRTQPTNIAIVPVGVAGEARRGRGRRRAREAPRRYRRAREAVMVGAGGVTLFVTGAILGSLIADAVDRYIAGYDPNISPAPTLAAPYTVDNPIPKWNNDSQAMQPGLARLGAQIGPAILFFLLGAVTKGAALRFFLYGLAGGFTVHVSVQIVTAYIIVPMVKNSTGMGQRMYQHEMNVYNGLANPSGGILGAGPANKPGAYGRRGLMGAPPVGSQAAPPQLPANQPAARIPVALASQPTPAQAAAAAPAAPAAGAPAQAAAPGMVGAPPAAHPAGCGCPQHAPPAPKQDGPHPLWSVLLDRAA